MKNTYILSMVVVLLLAFPCFGQVSTAQRDMIERSSTLDKTAATEQIAALDSREDLIAGGQKTDAAISKEMVSSVNEDIKEYLANGQIDEGALFIQSNMPDCKALTKSNLCEAGLNFTSGYFYQQAAKQDRAKKESYQKTAVTFYEQVLEIYPDNKLALNNLINLNQDLGDTDSTIKWLRRFVQVYPEDKVKYLVQIGNIYSDEGEFASACSAYRQAYEEDQFSEQACGAMVQLYTNNNFPCTLTSTMRQFAYDCQEINLANYSEKLLRKEFTAAMKDQDFKKAKESMILWAKVIVDNGWLDAVRVARLNAQLFPDDVEIPRVARAINLSLTELEQLFQAKNLDKFKGIQFKYWDADQPKIEVNKGWTDVRPVTVFAKILYMKGKESYFKDDHKTAEAYWEFALEPSEYFDPNLFTIVAADLAQLYTTSKDLNAVKAKFKVLERRLFGGKGNAYSNGDKKMIREFHITLGSIYYENEVWGGLNVYNARNAKFQLEHALSKDLGPIVNPELRKMLGDVYINLIERDKPRERIQLIEKAVDAYSSSIADYLSLDQIRKADRLHSQIRERYGGLVAENDKRQLLNELGSIIAWRKDLADPNNLLIKDEATIKQYLEKVARAEKKTAIFINSKDNKAVDLPSDFVQVQFFKGLSDLGSNFPDTRKKDKQLLYANALNRLKTASDLPSTRDFNRIKDIKFVLEESVDKSREIKTMQMQKKAVFTYDTGKGGNERVFSVPTFNKNISVPNQLFTLNDQLQDDYKRTDSKDLVKYKLDQGKFKLKTKDNNN